MSDAPADSQGRKSKTSSLTEAAATESQPSKTIPLPTAHTTQIESQASIAAILPSLRIFLGLSSTALVIAALYLGKELLIPLALAILLGFLLDPAVTRLKRWGLPRAAGAFVVVAIALSALFGAGTYLGSQLHTLSEDLPGYTTTIKGKLAHLRAYMTQPSMWDGALTTFSVVGDELAKTAAQTSGESASAKASIQKVQVVGTASDSSLQVLNWIERISAPALTTGIVTLFVILILIGRDDLRDRLLHLLGGNIHVATDALDEASERIGRYLRMQLLVNLSYGIPMGIGLWLIGVPGAVLWGAFAAVMRFVPYLGPALCAVFPLALAFAVDPTWNMLLWTMGLILSLELISNNVIEPWLYGSSTGLSTLSIIIAATFWTAIWGAIGLILSTPLTVCLLVMGRYVPSLRFMNVLLGSSPALGPPQRLYQRLVAGNVDEAIEMVNDQLESSLPDKASTQQAGDSLIAFFDSTAIPALRMASELYTDVATPQHRLRLVNGMHEILDDLLEEYPVASRPSRAPSVVCLGLRWEVDVLGAVMIHHALGLSGQGASFSPHTLASGLPERPDIPIASADIVCLSIFQTSTPAQIRIACRRLNRRWPHLKIVLALWNASADALRADQVGKYGAQAIATSIRELVLRIRAMNDSIIAPSETASDQEIERVNRLYASDALNAERTGEYGCTLQRIADIFDARYAQISWVDRDWVHTPGSLATKAASAGQPADEQGRFGLPRSASICSLVVTDNAPLVINDLQRDPRFASLPAVESLGLRFYAGVPLHDKSNVALGTLCLMDTETRRLDDEELAMLQELANELMETLSTPGRNLTPPPAST